MRSNGDGAHKQEERLRYLGSPCCSADGVAGGGTFAARPRSHTRACADLISECSRPDLCSKTCISSYSAFLALLRLFFHATASVIKPPSILDVTGISSRKTLGTDRSQS